MPKWSRLAKKNGAGFKWHLKPGPKKCPRDDHLKVRLSDGYCIFTFLVLKWPVKN
jgi:hypothetical protein